MATVTANLQSPRKALAPGLPRHYRAADLAELLRVSVSTIWRWNQQGNIPKGKPLSPGVTVWDGEEIDAWLTGPKAA